MGLFLKGIGLTMEESLTFWKQEFVKKKDIDADKFEKNYAYNIRHSYGCEGKRQDYKMGRYVPFAFHTESVKVLCNFIELGKQRLMLT